MNYKSKKLSNLSKGFTTLEILIAIVILVTGISAVAMVVFSNQTVALDSEVNTAGLREAKDVIESAKFSSHANFDSVVSYNSFEDIYTKNLEVNEINPCRKNIKSSVTWTVAPSRPGAVSLETSLVNPSRAMFLGGDCGPDAPTSNWENLVCNQDGFDFQPAGLKATGLDLIKRDGHKYVVLSAQGSSNGTDDLWIINADNATGLVKTSSLNTGPSLNDVDAAGNFAFTANNASTGQFQVIDISNLSAPSIIATRSLPGVGNSYPEGRKIFYYNNKVYIGTWETSGNEFHVFDVSNPANPTPLGSYSLNHSVQSIFVRDELIGASVKTVAYVGSSVTTPTAPEMVVLDVTVPSAIVQIGSFNPVGTLYGKVVYALGNTAYLGRERATGSNNDFFTIDISNKATINELDSAQLNLNANTEVRGMVISGGYAFISTSDQTDGFMVWNVKNPTDISQISSCNYPEKAVDMDFDGKYIYVANESNDGLRVIWDSSNP